MISATILGFPRIGPNREVKKLIEAFWAGKLQGGEKELLQGTKQLRLANYKQILEKSLEITAGAGAPFVLPVGDFSLYDHVLDTSTLFDVIPQRYRDVSGKLSPIEVYFAMGRGHQDKARGVDVPAGEMKKWFDSNYHFIVPEFQPDTSFQLDVNNKIVQEFIEARDELGIKNARPTILGPISFLKLGKNAKEAPTDFEPIQLLEKVIPAYVKLLMQLAKEGAEWVQIDEPVLVLDLPEAYKAAYAKVYSELAKAGLKIFLTTFFGALEENLQVVSKLPISALHIDLVRAPGQLDQILRAIQSTDIILSLGLVDGRNIWKTDLNAAIKEAQSAVNVLGKDRVIVASSSSLLHTPHSLAGETKLNPEIKDWFAFALEKVTEVVVIATALENGSDHSSVAEILKKNADSIEQRHKSPLRVNEEVRRRVAEISEAMLSRKSPYAQRRTEREAQLKLPLFPTTTIGSFPQTKEIRLARSKLNKNEINQEQYEKFMEAEIDSVIEFQENVGLDILVHGEPERNDMVAYFGELFSGFAFTTNGWVASYGTRYVRPPIIIGDVSRPHAMTVRWSKYAQSKTNKPVKGMLTGPVTILAWSFPRDDVSREVSAKQLALALRDEVIDLEKAGVRVIQVDEPALRETLPLRRKDWDAYLQWAVDSFRLATAGVEDSTQTHSHFCYSDFNDIFDAIKRLDADVVTIENSKSDMKLLKVFETQQYTNEIGPGVYDIHSPRVPSKEEIVKRAQEMLKYIPPQLLHINPDCGLKTRQWPETEASLRNLVAAAKEIRAQYSDKK